MKPKDLFLHEGDGVFDKPTPELYNVLKTYFKIIGDSKEEYDHYAEELCKLLISSMSNLSKEQKKTGITLITKLSSVQFNRYSDTIIDNTHIPL